MAKDSTSGLQGALDLLVLKTLESCARMHGYGITVHIQSRSEDALRIEEGSLYPALHRMEEAGWIQAEWAKNEAGRRVRLYELTAPGRKHLEAEEVRWHSVIAAVNRVLRLA